MKKNSIIKKIKVLQRRFTLKLAQYASRVMAIRKMKKKLWYLTADLNNLSIGWLSKLCQGARVLWRLLNCEKYLFAVFSV